MSLSTIRKGDTVIRTRGAGAGKTGKVLEVRKQDGVAVVEGMRIVKRAVRKSDAHPKGGFDSREAPISLSNLMPYCAKCKKGVRVGRRRDGDKDARVCKVCQNVVEN